jgi:hypothetical protein
MNEMNGDIPVEWGAVRVSAGISGGFGRAGTADFRRFSAAAGVADQSRIRSMRNWLSAMVRTSRLSMAVEGRWSTVNFWSISRHVDRSFLPAMIEV